MYPFGEIKMGDISLPYLYDNTKVFSFIDKFDDGKYWSIYINEYNNNFIFHPYDSLIERYINWYD